MNIVDVSVTDQGVQIVTELQMTRLPPHKDGWLGPDGKFVVRQITKSHESWPRYYAMAVNVWHLANGEMLIDISWANVFLESVEEKAGFDAFTRKHTIQRQFSFRRFDG